MSIRAAVLIFMAGFAASVGQILVLREFLVIFHGNELSSGLVLACWLICTAAGSAVTARIYRESPAGLSSLLLGFALLCAALPTTIVLIRAARAVWSIPGGELIAPGLMLLIALTATTPFCLLSGGLFALGWSLFRAGGQDGGSASSIYLVEAAGSGVGGLFFYFVLLPLLTPLAGSLALCIFLLFWTCVIAALSPFSGKAWSTAILVGILVLACVVFGRRESIDLDSRGMQWGKSFLQSLDTPYHNLTFLSKGCQYSLFANGLWLFSSPDPQSAEPAAHLPLLEHPNPKHVLVIGDYSPEVATEIFKHPGITRVDCVQPDPGLDAFINGILPASATAAAKDPRFHAFYMDPKQFMKTVANRYDVVILSAGEPVNAEMNRFYTVEFFTGVKRFLLGTGGLFSFRVPCPPDIIGPGEALLLKSLDMTLKQVFETVLVLPGEGACFLASRERDALTKDPLVLIDRLKARKLDLRYVRDFFIFDCLNPIRLAYLESILGSDLPARVNKDLEPVCYLYGLGLWSAQLHPSLGRVLKLISEEEKSVFAVFGIVFLGCLILIRTKGGKSAAVVFSTAVCGAILIIFEIALILLYQIIEGSAYRQLALVISFFMAGLAAGSALEDRLPPFFCRKVRPQGATLQDMPAGKAPPSLSESDGPSTVESGEVAGSRHPDSGEQAAGRLFVIQMGLAVYAGVLFLIFSPSIISFVQGAGRGVAGLCFSVLAFVAGMLGGAQFSAAVAVRGRMAGAGLYAADLAGAAVGAVVGSLFFLPVMGIPKTFLILMLGGFVASLALLGKIGKQ